MSFIQSFRAARWLRTINLVLQAVLFLMFFAGLNYLFLHYSWRWDLTRLRQHSLSAETLAYLKGLPQPVRVIVTLDENATDASLAAAYRDVKELLGEYTYATESNPAGRVSVEFINVDQRPREARQYGLHKNTVLFLSPTGEGRHQVLFTELYDFKNERREAFLGEQVFTSALLDVSSPQRQKIYFLTGHGEMDINGVSESRGLSALRDELRARNFAVAVLDLKIEKRVPDDAAIVISAGATNRYEPLEQELLRRYMSDRAGRLLLLCGPTVAVTGLEDLYFDWGLIADDVLVLDNGPDSQTDGGDLVLKTYWPHKITQLFLDNALQLRFGACRTVRRNPNVTDPALKVTKLVGASTTAWGERDYRRDRTYTPGADLRARTDPPDALAIVSSSERLEARDGLSFTVPVGRLVAFGCADFVANERLGSLANAGLFFNSVNWLANRDAQLNVRPRRIERYQLSFSQDEITRLRYSLLLGLPGAAALLGMMVYWARRN